MWKVTMLYTGLECIMMKLAENEYALNKFIIPQCEACRRLLCLEIACCCKQVSKLPGQNGTKNAA